MRRFEAVLLSISLLGFPVSGSAIQSQSTPTPPSPASSPVSITVPAGTKVELVVTRPEWAQSAKVGDTVYAQTSFPTVAGNGMAIPAGTYVEGTIESVTRPTRKFDRAEIQVLFTKIVFANGYTLELPGPDLPGATSAMPAPAVPAPGETPPGQRETLIAITIQVTPANDLLLDNGAEVEMTLGAPLQLDAKQVAQSIPLSRLPQPGQLKSATTCRNIPGSPGSPGSPSTVIPGSPGTPDITISQGPDLPAITIPGTPATPDTVIPGSPGDSGTPDYICPAKPLVISSTPVNNQPTQGSQPVAAR
ncbi:MAG: hypothetical protein ACLPLZ_06915 [Terracidiphilus sp.]